MEIIPNFKTIKEDPDLIIVNDNSSEAILPSSSFNHSIQTPEFDSSISGRYPLNSSFHYQQDYNIDEINQLQSSSHFMVDHNSDYHDYESNYRQEYQEPEENFISIDDLKAKPFLCNILKDATVEKNDKGNHKSFSRNQKDDNLIVIKDDDEDDDRMNNKAIRSVNYEDEDDEDDDVVFIENETSWTQTKEHQEQDKQTYECVLCNKKVASSYNLRRHMMIHTGERPFGCDICLKRFREFSDLKKHRRVHSHEDDYKCMVCKINPPSPTNPTKCNQCDVDDRYHRFANNYGDVLLESISTHIDGNGSSGGSNDKKGYLCPICDRTFGSRHNLKRHFMIHTGEKPYKCDECGKAFRELSTLKKHMITHSRIKLFKCSQCGNEYNDFNMYTRHKSFAHNSYNNYKFVSGMERTSLTLPSTSSLSLSHNNSNICNNGTTSDIVIASVCSGEEAIAVVNGLLDNCGGRSSNSIGSSNINKKYNFNNEYDNSIGDLKGITYECFECCRRFTNSILYKEHLKTHSHDFTFQCYICKKMFKTKEKLNSHFVTHDDDENYLQKRKIQQQTQIKFENF